MHILSFILVKEDEDIERRVQVDLNLKGVMRNSDVFKTLL